MTLFCQVGKLKSLISSLSWKDRVNIVTAGESIDETQKLHNYAIIRGFVRKIIKSVTLHFNVL